MRSWPLYLSGSMGLLCVGLFAAMVVSLVINAAPAVLDRPGIRELTFDHFSSYYTTGRETYGLLPAAFGTLQITLIALALALPVSLAMALLSTEMSVRFLGRAMRITLGTMAGVPPIVYALLAIVFVETFMIPKFAGGLTFDVFSPEKIGADPATWPPSDVPFNAGAYPWDVSGRNNSTLLAGAVVALMVIPFMAPLIEDALRNVPRASREASLALGASRWHTLRRVMLPMSGAGIISAIALGALKAMGDTLIIAFVVGWEAPGIPSPGFDVLERTPGLTAAGANLLGGFQGQGGCETLPGRCATGYATSVILLVFAALIVLSSIVLQALYRRRYSR